VCVATEGTGHLCSVETLQSTDNGAEYVIIRGLHRCHHLGVYFTAAWQNVALSNH
jgi:hypothetical protein